MRESNLSKTTGFKPPVIPSKHEIIPIHASDRSSFKMCRRRWDWSSPARNNLTPNVEFTSPYMPLWYGSGIHYALRCYYDPFLKRDPVEAFLYWYDLQWNGGICDEDFLEFTYDRRPQPIVGTPDKDGMPQIDFSKPTMYKVRGLKTMASNPDHEDFEFHKDLGENMMKWYRDYAAANDDFTVLMAEHTFSVPILVPETGEPLRMIDARDGNEKEVHVRGTQDAVCQDNENGFYFVFEHKTAAKIDEEYHEKLNKDEQCMTYISAARMEAEIYGLPYTDLDCVLYNALRKNYPKPPTILNNGLFSVDRSNECTTIEFLDAWMADNPGLALAVKNDPKRMAYIDWVREQGTSQFIERTFPVFRNVQEIESHRTNLYLETLDMLDDPRIYPNPTGSRSCTRCIFRAPCIAKDDGSDYQMMLDDLFERNWNR